MKKCIDLNQILDKVRKINVENDIEIVLKEFNEMEDLLEQVREELSNKILEMMSKDRKVK